MENFLKYLGRAGEIVSSVLPNPNSQNPLGILNPYGTAKEWAKSTKKWGKEEDQTKADNLPNQSGTNLAGVTVRYTGSNEGIRNSAANKAANAVYQERKYGLSQAGISLDKETGKVTVKAPEMAIKNETFRNQLKPVIDAISQNYKLKPDYKYALLNTKGDAKDEKNFKTSEDWVAELNKDLPQMVNTAIMFEEIKDDTENKTGVRWTDDQVRKRLNIALSRKGDDGKEYSVKDTDTQSIPKSIFEGLSLFKGAEGYDEEKRLMTYGDLMKVWNRGKSGDNSVTEIFDAVDEYFDNLPKTKEEREQNPIDPDELAEMTAFRDFINGKDPSSNIWYNIKDALKVTGGSAVTGVAGTLQAVGNLIESTIVNASEHAALAASLNLQGRGDELTEDMVDRQLSHRFQSLRDDLDKWKESIQRDYSRLSDTSASSFAIGSIGTELVGQIAVSIVASKIATGAVEDVVGSLATKFGKGTGSLAVLSTDAKQVANSSKTVSELTSDLYTGTNLMLRTRSAAEANKYISSSISIIRDVNRMPITYSGVVSGAIEGASGAASSMQTIERSARAAAQAAEAAAKTAIVVDNAVKKVQPLLTATDIAAQTAVDVALSDPKLFRQFMSGDSSDEDKAYMMEQLAWNVAGWGSAVVAGKALRSVGDSELGRVTNAFVAPKVEAISARMGETADNLKAFFLHHGDKDWLAKSLENKRREFGYGKRDLSDEEWNTLSRLERKQQVLESERLVREQQLKAWNLSLFRGQDISSWDDLVKRADTIKKNMVDTIAAAHVIANTWYRADISSMNARLAAEYSLFKSARDSYLDGLAKVNKLERAAGFDVVKMKTENILGKKIKAVNPVALSEEVNDYVNSIYRLRQANIAKDLVKDPDTLKGVKKEIEVLSKRIADYTKEFSPELKEAADNLEFLARNLSRETQNVRVSTGVMNSGDLNAMRTSEYFKDGYMRQQRMKDWEEYMTRRDSGEIRFSELRGDQHVKWGNVDDGWQDLSTVLFDDINETSKRIYRKEMVDQLKGLGKNVDVVVSGKDVQIVRNVTPLKKKVTNTIDLNTSKIVANADSDIFDNMFKKKEAKSLIMTQTGETVNASLDVNRARRAAMKPISDRSMVIALGNSNVVGDDVIEEIVVSKLGKPVSQFTADEFADFVKEAPEETKTLLRKTLGAKNTADITYNDFANALKNKKILSQNFESNLNRSLVRRNYKNMWDGKRGGRIIVQDARADKRLFNAKTLYKENIEKLKAIKEKYNIERMNTNIVDAIDDTIDDVIERNLGDEDAFKAMASMYGGDSVEDAIAYNTLKSLSNNSKDITEKFRSRCVSEFNKDLTANNTVVKNGKKIQKLSGNQIDNLANQWADEATDMFKESIKARYGEVSAKLAESGSEILDYDDYFGKLKVLNDDITKASKTTGLASNIVKTYDALGREEFVQLSPTIAQMITTMPRPLRRGWFGELRQTFVKAFRMGTTGGLAVPSLFRQAFRDTGSAVTTGGAVYSRRAAEAQIKEVFGEYLGEQIQREMPDLWTTLLRESSATGEDLATTFARREIARGASNVEKEFESRLYKFSKEQAKEMAGGNYVSRFASSTGDEVVLGPTKQSLWERFKNAVDEAYIKSEYLNNMRETYLRKRVYDNALAQGLKNGMGLDTSRRYAEFLQAEATTNFGRQIYHFANLSQTVPYLSAAVNGTKSFWRLWAFDPVGVTTRIVGGYVVPMMALLNISLGDPENKRVYKQIKEYEKDGNMVFVLDGQKISIPMPQEIASFVRPLQTMIETMEDANDHSLTELLANDLVGFMPYNWEGFVNVDSDRVLADNVDRNDNAEGNFLGEVVMGHLLPGFSKWSSQLMDPLAKSGVMVLTGYDPYTGRSIDRDSTMVDPETGERRLMDYNAGILARGLGEIFGNDLLPARAQALFNNLLGTWNVDVIESVITLGKAVIVDHDPLKGLTDAGEIIQEEVTKPFTIKRYDEESNVAWNRAVSQLYKEKNRILQDKQLQQDLRDLYSKAGILSDEAKNKIKTRIRTKVEDFQLKVLRSAENLVKNYDGGVLDKNKYASVLSLITFKADDGFNLDNPLQEDVESEESQLARATAIETMANYGFRGVQDDSIFGHNYFDNRTGKIVFEYNDPISILNFDKSTDLQDKMALAMIRDEVQNGGLWEKHEAVSDQINKLYDSGKKLSKQDRANIDAIKINWNAELMKTIAPIVKNMTPEAAINNKSVRDYLYPYVEVPGEWSVNDRNRHPSLGSRGSSKAAYYQSWIKSMYGINDKYKGQY